MNSLFSLRGRTAIVSGVANAGIGFAIAQILAEAGASVAILYNRSKSAIDAAETISKSYRVRCSAYQVDMTKQADVEAVIAQIVRDYNGRLDIFVANSGIAWDEVGAIDSSVAHYHQVMSTNLDSVYYCARAAGWHFRRQAEEKTTVTGEALDGFKSGSFVATASMSGHIVNVPHLQAAYNTSKAGVIHLCKSLAVEWAGFARANTVSPGFVESGLTGECSDEVKESLSAKTPMRRIGHPDELKGAYLYLASDAASFTTGADIVVDGGYCLP
ncbi:putative NADP-dependent mannitol dehydrogenase [Talaromyces islandicus]|uniref:Putative NADP-dependent mannitol dehydrogenase n=1 Tax=Talaromyces islandicus TaxID=28573 RepID=A0A0U1M8L4_TALIS|nr:putative NADP-dependent mannitol dehydrogenase [Talaromyces islandicus]